MPNDIDKIQNPFSKDEREILFRLAKLTKENEITTGYERKVLFQSGKYDDLFINRIQLTIEIIYKIHENVFDDFSDEDRNYLESIKIKCDNLDVEILELEYKQLKNIIRDDELIQLCMLYERSNKIDELVVTTNLLLNKYPENQTLLKIINRHQEHFNS